MCVCGLCCVFFVGVVVFVVVEFGCFWVVVGIDVVVVDVCVEGWIVVCVWVGDVVVRVCD